MEHAKETTFREYRYRQLERDIMTSQQKRKRKTMNSILPTKSKLSITKAEYSNAGLNAVIHGHLNGIGAKSYNDNSDNITPDKSKRMTQENPVNNKNDRSSSQILNVAKSQGQLSNKSDRIINNTQTTSGNISNGANNTLGDTFCISNSDKDVRVFYGWTVMLNKQYQLVIKGTLQCGTAARSKPVQKRLSAFSVMSIFQHKYILKENLVDEGNELPDYVRSKFCNGFPDDWENVYHLWKKFVMEGCRESFCWPSLSLNSDDDVASEITDVTIIDTRPQSSKHKTLSPIEIDDESNTDDTEDSLSCSQLKICKVTNSSTQTPNSWQEDSGSNDVNLTRTMEKLNVQKEKLICSLNNVTQMHWPEECLHKIIEMIECFDYVISYKHFAENKSKQPQVDVQTTNFIVQHGNFNDRTSKHKSMCAINDTTYDAHDENIVCGKFPKKKYNQRSDKNTNTFNTPDYDENRHYEQEEDFKYQGNFRQNKEAHNVSPNDILSSKAVTAKTCRQKGNANSLTSNINYSSLNKDDTQHVQVQEHLHLKTNAKCQDYTNSRAKAVTAEVDNISSEDSHYEDIIVNNDNANTDLTFQSHSISPKKRKPKPSIQCSEKININMKILPRHDSIFMQDESDSSFSDNDKQSAHSKALQTHKAFAESDLHKTDFNDTNISSNEGLDNQRSISSDSSMEQAEFSGVPSTSKQHAFGSEANPKTIKSWIPNVLPCHDDEPRFGLVFKGCLLNETGHVVKENFSTSFVLRQLSAKFFECIDGDYYQLIGRLYSPSEVPKHMRKQCRNGCPADIDKFCKLWKLGITDSSNVVRSASVNDLNVQVSSRGRRVLPPLRYWSGERAVLKDDNLAYDSGNFDISIITTAEQTPTRASNVHNQENQTANVQTLAMQQKQRSKSTDKLDRSKRKKSVKESNQTAEKKFMRKKESNEHDGRQVLDAASKEKMLRKRIAQQLQFGSSESDTDEMTEDVPKVIVKDNRAEYVSKLRKRKKMDDDLSNTLPRMSTTRTPRVKSGDRERNSSVSCTYVRKTTQSPEALSDDDMSIVN